MATARVDALVAVATMDVAAPPSGGGSDAIVVDSFSMIEFQIPPHRRTGRMRRRCARTPSRGTQCRSRREICDSWSRQHPGVQLWREIERLASDLFGELVRRLAPGDCGGAQRATGDQATVTMTFLDNGKMATRVVSGPTFRGASPRHTRAAQTAGRAPTATEARDERRVRCSPVVSDRDADLIVAADILERVLMLHPV